MSHPCLIWVSGGLFDAFQKDVQCLHLRCPSYNCHGLIHCPDLCHASMHEQKHIQDLHSLIHEGIGLHSDCNLNGSYELFSFVPISRIITASILHFKEWLGCYGRKLFYCSEPALLNDDDNDEEEILGEYVQVPKQLMKIGNELRCREQEGSHGIDN